jgi:DNA-binding transcriptional LysR family regulator
VDLRQLEYFAAVARHRHFTRAAEELYVTQSALSQQVRRLEAELGLPLLVRGSRGVELTPAGTDLLARADSILAELARARADMDAHVGAERGLVRVAAAPADAQGLPEALVAFHREHPGIRVALRHGSAREVADLVATGSADLGVAASADGETMSDEPLRVALPAGDPLAGSEAVELWDLRDRPFILA